ncbi:hypothetical protein EDC65_2681 [Stella humosa]|uniref:Lipoprotein n=1 Tax=Stella humosa TaxID=94 RepID=A0A3N1LHJ4_9PROT|nr:hypothetical protein [Stella humosa]ROP90822.1 hypothetical protein EDC65_2681 [Stella humosa]BBK34832.1 hypothetical protein STHU_54660 [Stella humosa]
MANSTGNLRAPTLLALAATGLVLAGCGSLNPFGKSETPPACPRAVVVNDLSRVTEYRPGAGRDLSDVVYSAGIERVDSTCEYDRRRKVTMQTTVNLVVERGPADRARQAQVTYFVAVADAANQVLARETFTVPVKFEGNVTRMQASEEIEQVIQLGGGTGAGHKIFVGFPLTEEQLNQNRRR